MMTTPSLISAPQTFACLRQGFDQLAALLALTLGPTQGIVLNDRDRRSPEMLADSATIARRVIELPQRGADAGAMTLRHMVWRLHERYGDGAATAAVLAQAMLQEASKSLAAGANPMLLRHGIERGVAAAGQSLAAQAEPAAGQETLARLATGITGDPQLGLILGEMFDVLGEYAAITVEEFVAPYLEREYLDGGRWPARPSSRLLMPGENSELLLQQPYVWVVDQKLDTLAQVQPALEAALQAPDKAPLFIIAREVTGEALGTLTLNHGRGKLVIGAATLTNFGHLGEDLDDVALLTGATLLSEVTGRPAERTGLADFGRARQVTLSRERLTLVGGAGDRQAIRKQITELRQRLAQVDRADNEWDRLRLRAARLAGGIGVLKIGAHTKMERELKQEQAKKAIRTLEFALAEGVVTGGGVAYLAAVPAVLAIHQDCANEDEARGVAIVAAALAAPFKQIVYNHGLVHPAVALHEVSRLGPGYGFDALTGTYTPMASAGVLDCLSVTRGALEAAASAAAMLITTDVLVFTPSRHQQRQMAP
jgi:chaperonin GroEL